MAHMHCENLLIFMIILALKWSYMHVCSEAAAVKIKQWLSD